MASPNVPEDRQREGLIIGTIRRGEKHAFGYHKDPAYRSGLLMDNRRSKRALSKKTGTCRRAPPPKPNWRQATFRAATSKKIVLAREIERNPDLAAGSVNRPVARHRCDSIHSTNKISPFA